MEWRRPDCRARSRTCLAEHGVAPRLPDAATKTSDALAVRAPVSTTTGPPNLFGLSAVEFKAERVCGSTRMRPSRSLNRPRLFPAGRNREVMSAIASVSPPPLSRRSMTRARASFSSSLSARANCPAISQVKMLKRTTWTPRPARRI